MFEQCITLKLCDGNIDQKFVSLFYSLLLTSSVLPREVHHEAGEASSIIQIHPVVKACPQMRAEPKGGHSPESHEALLPAPDQKFLRELALPPLANAGAAYDPEGDIHPASVLARDQRHLVEPVRRFDGVEDQAGLGYAPSLHFLHTSLGLDPVHD